MNIIVPYTKRSEAQELALHVEGITAAYVPVEGTIGYWELLRGLWTRGETFIILEHDVLPWPGALAQLWACPELWCAFPYRLGFCQGYTPALGCTKFSAALLAQVPDALERLAEKRDFWCEGDARHWSGLDGRLSLVLSSLTGAGWPHRHEPPVIHLNAKHAAGRPWCG